MIKKISPFFLSIFLWLQGINASVPCVGQESHCQDEFYESPCSYYQECTHPCFAHFYGEIDYLYWQMSPSKEPVPLVTRGPLVPDGAPVLDQPGTEVVLGEEDIAFPFRSGARFKAGCWFDPAECFGTEISYIFLSNRSKSLSVSSSGLAGSSFLALPFLNAQEGLTESSTAIALPGLFAGEATLKINNDMSGMEWNAIALLPCWESKVYLISGFRYWNFNEYLSFKTSSPSVMPPLDLFTTKDRFNTYNHYFSGQFGLEGSYSWSFVFIRARGKMALGAMKEELEINGSLKTNDFELVEEFPAGYFALPTNHVHQSQTHFAFLPEINIDLGFNLTKDLNIHLGYTFLYVSRILWSGEQIDRKINPSQAPAITGDPSTRLDGIARPKPLFKSSAFWAHGLNVGIDFDF